MQYDVKIAFIDGDLNEEICIKYSAVWGELNIKVLNLNVTQGQRPSSGPSIQLG